MIPDEVVMLRAARQFGMPPWVLERALDDDPAALRWWLMAPHLEEFEATISRASTGG